LGTPPANEPRIFGLEPPPVNWVVRKRSEVPTR